MGKGHSRLFVLILACILLGLGPATTPARAQAPQITSLSNTVLERSGRLLIFGSGFGGDQASGQVLIDGVDAIVTTWTDAEIHAYVPESAGPGVVSVEVLTSAGLSNAAALDATLRQVSGRIRWTLEMDSAFPGAYVAVGADGTVYATDISRMYALSPDGGLKWVLEGAGGRRPITLGFDGTIYTGARSVVAVNPNGTFKWQFAPATGPRELVAGPGVGPDGNIYAVHNSLSGGLGAFSLDPDGSLLWSNPAPGTSSFPGSNWKILFGADRLFTGVTGVGSAPPTVGAYDFDGNQLWWSGNLMLSTGSMPQLDSFGRVIVRWGQIGMMALSPDGEMLWQAEPPEPVGNVIGPVVGPDDTIFTGTWLGRDLWTINPDGSTRLFLPDSVEGFLGNQGVSPDNAVWVDNGSPGFGFSSFIRGFDPSSGALLWRHDLPRVDGLNQFTYAFEPTFTADNQTAFITTWFSGGDTAGFLHAVDIVSPGGPPPVNQPPVAVATATPMSGPAPLTVVFDSAGSMDPDGRVMFFDWDFGDGGIGGGVVTGHTYANAGTYVATLTVTDDDDATGSASVVIDVSGPPGVCTLDCLRSTAISLSAKARRGKVTVTGRVKVQDEAGAIIRNAMAVGTWTLPGGGQTSQSASTNRKGEAAFSVAGGSGTYTLTVTDITKASLTFDPDNSVLSKSITK